MLSLRPDLVLTGRHSSPATRAALKRLGIPAELFAVPNTVEESLEQVRQVARAVHRPERGEALIAQVRAGFVPQPEAAGAFGYDFRAAVEMIREANALLDEAGISLDTDPRRVEKSGAAQDAAQLAAVEIAATGAAAPQREAPAQD